MLKIGKDGKVIRLTKASWDITIPYDSDPNCAISKMQARIVELEKQKTPSPAPQAPAHGCNFDDKKLGDLIKDKMEDVLSQFTKG